MSILEPDRSLRAARLRGEMARKRVCELSQRLRSRGSATAHVEELVAALDEALAQAAGMTAAPPAACKEPRSQWRRKALAAALMMAALVGLGVAMTGYADLVRSKFGPRVAVVSSGAG